MRFSRSVAGGTAARISLEAERNRADGISADVETTGDFGFVDARRDAVSVFPRYARPRLPADPAASRSAGRVPGRPEFVLAKSLVQRRQKRRASQSLPDRPVWSDREP